jgi:hypothetical protein
LIMESWGARVGLNDVDIKKMSLNEPRSCAHARMRVLSVLKTFKYKKLFLKQISIHTHVIRDVESIS